MPHIQRSPGSIYHSDATRNSHCDLVSVNPTIASELADAGSERSASGAVDISTADLQLSLNLETASTIPDSDSDYDMDIDAAPARPNTPASGLPLHH